MSPWHVRNWEASMCCTTSGGLPDTVSDCHFSAITDAVAAATVNTPAAHGTASFGVRDLDHASQTKLFSKLGASAAAWLLMSDGTSLIVRSAVSYPCRGCCCRCRAVPCCCVQGMVFPCSRLRVGSAYQSLCTAQCASVVTPSQSVKSLMDASTGCLRQQLAVYQGRATQGCEGPVRSWSRLEFGGFRGTVL